MLVLLHVLYLAINHKHWTQTIWPAEWARWKFSRLYLLGTMNVCTKCHDNPSVNTVGVSVWTKVVVQPTNRVTDTATPEAMPLVWLINYWNWTLTVTSVATNGVHAYYNEYCMCTICMYHLNHLSYIACSAANDVYHCFCSEQKWITAFGAEFTGHFALMCLDCGHWKIH